jgi:NADH-quinone oxidoreductase subunit E
MEEVRQDLSPILDAFPREQQLLLPALQRVQEELGYLPLWALEAVGEHLRVPKSEVYGVATHFPELRLEPEGEHVIRVCTGLSCRLLGASAVLANLEAALAVRAGETTPDGKVTLAESHCAFICGVAPVVEIDGIAHGGPGVEQAIALFCDAIEARR